MYSLKENGLEFVWPCSFMWVQAYKQLVNAFSSYAYIRYFGVGTGLEWWVDTRVMQIVQ